MKAGLSALALFTTLALAQERCDAPYPNVFCNTTEILAYKTSDCRPFHVFLTRGSDEPYPGRLGNLTKEICSNIGGTEECGFESVEYPAKSTAWGVNEWCKSAGAGAKNGQAQIKAYAEKCPDAKLILLGFSQGASVAQDILGGGGGHVFECDQADNPALDADSGAGKNIIAALTFGAVIRSRNQNFTLGAGKPFDGRRARTPSQLAALNNYADVLLDYCHFGDPMCAVGSTPPDVYAHLDYFLLHNDEVVAYVGGVARAAAGLASSVPSRPLSGNDEAGSGNSSSSSSSSSSRSSVPVQTASSVSASASAAPSASGAPAVQTGGTQTGAARGLAVREGLFVVVFAALVAALA